MGWSALSYFHVQVSNILHEKEVPFLDGLMEKQGN